MESGGEAFSSIDIVVQCLLDKPRVTAVKRAIQKKVKKGDEVLDAGTGAGILALFAAKAGARKVVALEFDSYIAAVARNIISENRLEHIIHVEEGDARIHRYSRRKPFDVVIMEMLTTGMVDEFQVQAVNNLHRQKLIGKNTRLIPERQTTLVTIGFYDFKNYGLELPSVRHLWRFLSREARAFKRLGEPVTLNSVSFDVPSPERVSVLLDIPIVKTGTVNGLYLESVTTLSKGFLLGDTDSINAPVIIPLTLRKVTRGAVVKLLVEYQFGGGYRRFKAQLRT